MNNNSGGVTLLRLLLTRIPLHSMEIMLDWCLSRYSRCWFFLFFFFFFFAAVCDGPLSTATSKVYRSVYLVRS